MTTNEPTEKLMSARDLSPETMALKAPISQARLTHHVFVCTGVSCSSFDSQAVLEAFWAVLAEKGLLYGKRGTFESPVVVTTCGSVGLCQIGPAVLIYPEGTWYYGVRPEDVDEIVTEHVMGGRVVERLKALTLPSDA